MTPDKKKNSDIRAFFSTTPQKRRRSEEEEDQEAADTLKAIKEVAARTSNIHNQTLTEESHRSAKWEEDEEDWSWVVDAARCAEIQAAKLDPKEGDQTTNIPEGEPSIESEGIPNTCLAEDRSTLSTQGSICDTSVGFSSKRNENPNTPKAAGENQHHTTPLIAETTQGQVSDIQSYDIPSSSFTPPMVKHPLRYQLLATAMNELLQTRSRRSHIQILTNLLHTILGNSTVYSS